MKTFDPHSAIHRHAIWTVHGERCYQCGKPIDLLGMQVDHVIPQSLGTDEVTRLIREYGRPEDFDVQDFENLLPSCAPCNRLKSDAPWDPSPIVQRWLQRAADKKGEVLALIKQTIKEHEVSKALNTLQRLHEKGELTAGYHDLIRDLSLYQVRIRVPEMRGEPFRATKTILIPLSTEMSTKDTYTVTWHGPITLSLGPNGALVKLPAVCKKCGSMQFNHTTCRDCGHVH